MSRAGSRKDAPRIAVEFTDSEIDALEKILRQVKKQGLGHVEFNVRLIDPIRRVLRAALKARGLLEEVTVRPTDDGA